MMAGVDWKSVIEKRDVRVKDWADLIDLLHVDSFDRNINRYRSPYVFRGLDNSDYDLKTSLIRLGHDSQRTELLEPVILRSFRKYAHRDASPGNSVWHWLSLAQHHGLPTRLLDWSASPYVAAHFATEDPDKFSREPEKPDAVIWCVNTDTIKNEMPSELQQILSDYYAKVFYVEILEERFKELADFDTLADEPFPIFFEPPSLDERITNQFALFSMLSSPTAQMEKWIANHPHCVKRIIIPHGLKWEIRDKLDQMNLTERVIYPGLDGLSKWLQRYYSPRQ